MRRNLTPDELWKLELDEDALQTLAMTPAEIRADLVAMGCDPDDIERKGREFLESRRKRGHLRLVAKLAGPVGLIAMLIESVGPVVPEVLPFAAAPNDPPAVTAAAAPAPSANPNDPGPHSTKRGVP